MQEASQRLASVVLGLLGHAGIRYPVETVIRPRIHVELDRHRPDSDVDTQGFQSGHGFAIEISNRSRRQSNGPSVTGARSNSQHVAEKVELDVEPAIAVIDG